jgi:hypothetical protein
MGDGATLLSLPYDVLFEICQYFNFQDFVSFASSRRQLQLGLAVENISRRMTEVRYLITLCREN